MDTFRETFDTVVCGAGPAGLSAALASVSTGASTLLLERLDAPGIKLLASGGGRCNFSNILSETEFMARFGRNGRFMVHALQTGGKPWLFAHLRSRGIEPAAEDGFHYFPSTGRASSIRDAFLIPALEAGLALRTSCPVKKLLVQDGVLTGCETERGHISCRKFILAAGGTAMPSLGGTPLGLELARDAGHRIVPTLPAMAPLCLADEWIPPLAGVSLPDAELEFSAGSRHGKERGELLFTHDGLSGPAALNLSGDAVRAWTASPEKFHLTLRADASADFHVWLDRIETGRLRGPARLFRSIPAQYMPNSLASVFAGMCGLSETKNQSLRKQDREKAAVLLGGTELKLRAPAPMSRAMAMSGGVALSEIDPDTMESRLVKRLFFAGEIVDLTGPCGGYNIQFAIASGRLAGLSQASG